EDGIRDRNVTGVQTCALPIFNTGHTKAKIWTDGNIQSRRQAFNEGLLTGLKNPTGKGQRLTILHIGNKHGFVDDGLLVFEGIKRSEERRVGKECRSRRSTYD